ncbi:MAG: tripartite tricarboxylate transporter substrate binding protein [Bradyrhizobiaceae bacterium]|nr:tripartite tricarboxylate transporter substrate binding protein [Bradyrhizobiaceae bacterium]
MKLHRRHFLELPVVSAALLAALCSAWAQNYPTRPVHLMVGYPPGIAPDVIARLIAQPLSDRLGQQVTVENRPGAGSNMAAEMVARSPADGYTLLYVTITNAVNATLFQNLSFDIVRDFAPIASIDRAPLLVVVTKSLPPKTIGELIAYAKANPGKINYASAGYGTANHIAGELLKVSAGIDLVHVPYRNSYIPDLLAGEVAITFAPLATVSELAKAGKLRILAVTGAQRSPALPNIPAIAEFVPGYEYNVWHGIVVPKGTATNVVKRLNADINACLADQRLVKRLADLGSTAFTGSPEEFGKFIADETEKWGKVVREANIKSE